VLAVRRRRRDDEIVERAAALAQEDAASTLHVKLPPMRVFGRAAFRSVRRLPQAGDRRTACVVHARGNGNAHSDVYGGKIGRFFAVATPSITKSSTRFHNRPLARGTRACSAADH
jgi:hypothetical protein